jgi:SNF2-related domain
MMNFVNPGLLGMQSTFQRVFAQPIEASREADATRDALALGGARAAELSRTIDPFQLRRTADINSRYLPPCLRYVVFCRPTKAQLAAYARALREESGGLLATNKPDGTQVLTLIGKLRQVCNHPDLAGMPPEVRLQRTQRVMLCRCCRSGRLCGTHACGGMTQSCIRQRRHAKCSGLKSISTLCRSMMTLEMRSLAKRHG